MVSLHDYLHFRVKPVLFDGLSDKSLEHLVPHCYLREHQKSVAILHQGERPEGIYIILEGQVRAHHLDQTGIEATIRLLEPGDSCLEEVLYGPATALVTLQSLTRSKIIVIPQKIAKAQVLADSRFALNLLELISLRYRSAVNWISALNLKSTLERVGYYFLQRFLDAGSANLEFSLTFNKKTIANYLGMTPESFSRALTTLRASGIEDDDGLVRLKNAFSLCEFCDQDTASRCHNYGREECSRAEKASMISNDVNKTYLTPVRITKPLGLKT